MPPNIIFKQIPLTQGKVALVDDADFERLNQWKWRSEKRGRTFRAIRTAYSPETMKRKTVLMHRQILKATSRQEIDHRNGNGLDNRKQNLRFCTHYQNLGNARKRKNCSSKYKGVSWCKRTQKWLSQIMHNYKNIHLGSFDSEIKAAKAYNKAAIKYFGEFACLNFS